MGPSAARKGPRLPSLSVSPSASRGQFGEHGERSTSLATGSVTGTCAGDALQRSQSAPGKGRADWRPSSQPSPRPGPRTRCPHKPHVEAADPVRPEGSADGFPGGSNCLNPSGTGTGHELARNLQVPNLPLRGMVKETVGVVLPQHNAAPDAAPDQGVCACPGSQLSTWLNSVTSQKDLSRWEPAPTRGHRAWPVMVDSQGLGQAWVKARLLP